MTTVTTRRFPAGTASSWGILVGGLVMYLTMPKRAFTLWQDRSTRASGRDGTRNVGGGGGGGGGKDSSPQRRSLGGHVQLLEHEHALEGGGTLRWTVLNASSVEFELTLPGQPAWMALAASAEGLMIGSSAVVASWDRARTEATIVKYHLNQKALPSLPVALASAASPSLTRTDTHTKFRFKAGPGTFGEYTIPGARDSTHAFIFAFGKDGNADGLQYHESRKKSIGRLDLWAGSKPGPQAEANSILLKGGGKLEWELLSATKVRFDFYVKGAPGWLSFGFSEKGNMVGPPASTAVVGWWKGETGHVSSLDLNSKPPTQMPVENDPIMANATLEKNVDGEFTLLSFIVDGALGGSNPTGAYDVPGPSGTKHNFIYAWGSAEDTGLRYHSPQRRGNVNGVDLGKIPTGFDASQEPEIPYFAVHGGTLATIWSLTTLVGGVIARYFRYKSWWIDAHEFLQTVATVLSLPLTVLSWMGKGGTNSSAQHYSSVHGMFGIVFATAASVQGTLGSISHMMFAHTNGCICKQHKLMARVRSVHRSLGKSLLLVATAQIVLGLRHFEPPDLISGKLGTLTILFIAYASIAWGSVIILEIRHQRALCSRNRAQKGSAGRTKVQQSGGSHDNNVDTTDESRFKFYVTTGAGYMTEDDLRQNDRIFVKVCEFVDALIQSSNRFENASAAVSQWCQSPSGPGLGLPGKILKTSRINYPTDHRSMKTSEVLIFSKWLALEVNPSASTPDQLTSEAGGEAVEVEGLKSSVNDLLIEKNEIQRGTSYYVEKATKKTKRLKNSVVL
jgi:hypothetical protein